MYFSNIFLHITLHIVCSHLQSTFLKYHALYDYIMIIEYILYIYVLGNKTKYVYASFAKKNKNNQNVADCYFL